MEILDNKKIEVEDLQDKKLKMEHKIQAAAGLSWAHKYCIAKAMLDK